jgi:hypothetical protein
VICVVDRGLPAMDNSAKRIDIWWRGQQNGSLMLILAHLLRLNWEWRRSTIRVLRLIREEAGRQPAQEALHGLIQAARMKAEACVLVSDAPFAEVLKRHSASADALFMGITLPEPGTAEATYRNMEKTLDGLPTTLLIDSSGEADLFA